MFLFRPPKKSPSVIHIYFNQLLSSCVIYNLFCFWCLLFIAVYWRPRNACRWFKREFIHFNVALFFCFFLLVLVFFHFFALLLISTIISMTLCLP